MASFKVESLRADIVSLAFLFLLPDSPFPRNFETDLPTDFFLLLLHLVPSR